MSEMNEIRRRINQAIARGDEKEAAFARAEFWQTKAESLQRENEELKRKLDRFRSASCANCGAGPSSPGIEQEVAEE